MAGKFRETVVQRSSQSVGKTPNPAGAPAATPDETAAAAAAGSPEIAGASQVPDVNAPQQASDETPAPKLSQDAINALAEAKAFREAAQREIGGPKGPEPTRFGDWEHKGRCIDF
ncbi:DUF1674 domain-containing protein [Thalassospira marina]|uniref:DUF1674 domain-containing protein n=1 Tax=Thalassospira marina TaxID=2048283 RepID=UPI003CCB766B